MSVAKWFFRTAVETEHIYSTEAFGAALRPQSLIWPPDSVTMINPPSVSVTACSFEFRPPFVHPIRRGVPAFLRGLLPCGALSDE
jgi:hypothetical protein